MSQMRVAMILYVGSRVLGSGLLKSRLEEP